MSDDIKDFEILGNMHHSHTGTGRTGEANGLRGGQLVVI